MGEGLSSNSRPSSRLPCISYLSRRGRSSSLALSHIRHGGWDQEHFDAAVGKMGLEKSRVIHVGSEVLSGRFRSRVRSRVRSGYRLETAGLQYIQHPTS